MENTVVLQLDPTPDNPRNSEGAFITLRDGRILFAYTRFTGGGDDFARSDIAATESSDGGRTWSEPRIIVPNRGEQNTMSVTMLRLHDGRIFFSYCTKDGMGGLPYGNCRPWALFSDDEAETWSEPIGITQVHGYYVQNNDRIVQLSQDNPHAPGRFIAPLAYHRISSYDPETDHMEMESGLVMWRVSDDNGATWHESDSWWALPVVSGSGLQEPGLIELRDGTISCWSRTDTGNQWGSTSTDGGTTWTPFEPLDDFVSPCSPLSIKRVPEGSGDASGQLLAVWNDHSGRWDLPRPPKESWGRTPLIAALSDDDGRTWRHHRILEDDPDSGYCYTAIHFVDDADGPAALLAYCAGGKATGSVLNTLRMRRLSMDWLSETN